MVKIGESSPDLTPPEDYGDSTYDPNLTLPPELCDKCKDLGYCKDLKYLETHTFIDGFVCGNVPPF